MGLVRVYSQLSSILINRFGQAAGPSSKNVDRELNNIIAWSKSALRCIHRDISIVGNVGGGVDPLHTYTLDTPNRLLTNGDYLRVRYAGRVANTEDDKQLQFLIDGQVSLGMGAVIDLENGSWIADITYTRISSTSIQAAINALFLQLRMADGVIVTSPSGSFIDPQVNTLTVSDLNSNAIVLTVKAEGTNNDDVTQSLSIIELCQQ